MIIKIFSALSFNLIFKDYYRFDIGFNIEGNHRIKKFAHSFWNISVYNVLGRNNPYSVYFVTDKGETKTQTFSSDDELELLKDVQKLLDRCGKLDFHLCGHNLKNFDIPMLAKRMIINGLMPPSILPSYDTKPWEIKAIDTREIWQYGAYTSIGSLDLVCSTMGIDTPKDGPIHGGNVHEVYWNNQSRLDEISEYCEKDVKVLVDFITKLKELK